jgi:NADPH:quinone reductase-like Zn-dependent oxidoreductase
MIAFELQAGSIETLRAVERPAPVPGPHEVVLKMRAAALNARDIQIARAHYPIAKGFPLVPLSDGVGEVTAVGADVTRVKVGDRVAGIFAQRWLDGTRSPSTWSSTLGGDLDGVLREFVALHEDGVVKVPAYLSDEEAATLPTPGVTAWQALVTLGGVKPGDNVLVRGTGGVSLFALQFARLAGARVIVTSRSRAKLERARAAGASDTVRSTDADWTSQVREMTAGEGVDHVVETVGDLQPALECLRIGGVVSQIGYLANLRLECGVIPLLLANARLHGITVGPRSTFEQMIRALALHRLRPIIDTVVPFVRASDAFAAFESETRFGKVVVRF